MDAGQVHTETVLALAQIGRFQNLLALQGPVRLKLNYIHLIIWILEEETPCAFARPDINGTAQPGHQNHPGENAQSPPNAMLGHSAGADFHVEQVLLAPVAHFGHAPILRLGAFVDHFHFRFPSVLALESAMMRAQRST